MQVLSYPFNQVGLNHLLVVEVPFEFNFKISRLDAQVFGDAAYNLEGAQRAQDAATAYSQILLQNGSPNAQRCAPFVSRANARCEGLSNRL